MFVDVNHFRNYNEEFGRAAADHALYGVAQTMMNNVRPTDLVARYGGEKFLIILPDTDVAGAKVVAGRLCESVAEAVIVMSDQSILPSVTVSIGIAQMKAFQSSDVLIADAQAALTRAKETGRNCLAE